MSEFQLTPYEDLPRNEQLMDKDDLVEHTIKAVFDCPLGRDGETWANLVIVTESGCWLVLNAESDSCNESASIDVVRTPWSGEKRTLHFYVNARDLFTAGVINGGERDVLQNKEDQIKADRKAEKAKRLRNALAQLEGGAA